MVAWAIGGFLAVSVVAGLVYKEAAGNSAIFPPTPGGGPGVVSERVREAEPVRIIVPGPVL